jgi:hypothetical protein
LAARRAARDWYADPKAASSPLNDPGYLQKLLRRSNIGRAARAEIPAQLSQQEDNSP